MSTRPRILLIDDEPSNALLPDDCEPFLFRPEQLRGDIKATLDGVALILLDQHLELSEDFSLEASDGASLVGHLRSWARHSSYGLPPLAIYTSDDVAFAEEIPVVGPAVPIAGSFVGQEARLAPSLDIEWMFFKGQENTRTQIADLAHSSMHLNELTANGRASLKKIIEFLAPTSDAIWRPVAEEHMARARPPVNDPDGTHHEGARGVTPTLRWLLHRTLPFPGVLLSDNYAAWTLGLTTEALAQILGADAPSMLAHELQKSLYQGPCKSLFPRRWWAAGVNFASWKLRQLALEYGGMQKALEHQGLSGNQSEMNEQVVVLNMDFQEEGLAPLTGALQIRPPGWPVEAGDPWMRTDLISSEPLALAMLDPDDRGRLKS